MEVNAQIEKFQKEIIQTKDTQRQAALDEIQSAEAELDTIREQIRQADSVLTRTVVKAPVSGTCCENALTIQPAVLSKPASQSLKFCLRASP